MKCPKCGYVSYPGLAQCKKCGTPFVGAPQLPSVAAKTTPIPSPALAPPLEEEAIGSPPAGREVVQREAAEKPPQDQRAFTTSASIAPASILGLSEPLAEKAKPVGAAEPSWRQELSERVQNFRRRRARLRNEPPPEESLDFEFEPREMSASPERSVEEILEFPQNGPAVDAEITPSATRQDLTQQSAAQGLEKDGEGLEIAEPARAQADQLPIKPAAPAGDPLELVVGPSDADTPETLSQMEFQALPVASLGRRFQAGLVDGLLLLLGAGLFALIFWRAGGHLTPVPANLTILAFIAVFYVWAYFGLFTALTFSTPGLAWMGIEVRNMEGWHPNLRESLLRAFGYLVSISALMLGFLWALVDTESFTWHDWISGTFLTPMNWEPLDEDVELNA